MWIILDFFRYCLCAMALGFHPAAPYEREAPWPLGLKARDKAGAPLGHRYVLVDIKVDWQEIGTSFAMPTWASRLFPCKSCCADKVELRSISMECAIELPYAATTADDYERACARAEI